MNIRVCHVTSVHPWNDGRIFRKECTSLAKKYDVFLIAPNVEEKVVNNVHIKGVELSPSRIRRIGQLSRVLKVMKSIDADIYHLHDPELISIGVKLKKKGKIIVYDSHEDTPADIALKPYLPKWFRDSLSKVYALYERNVLKRYDALVTVTPSIVERLKNINRNTIQVTNYPLYQDLSQGRTFNNNICFAGGVSASWMHGNIIDSLSKIDVQYQIAGPAKKDYINHLSQRNNWGKVKYHGVIDHSKVIDLYHQSIAGMALYDYNGYLGTEGTLGNTKIFEIMQAGIPFIATDFRLWKEIVDKYKCGICVNPRNVVDIENAIKYLLENPEEAQRMGDNGISAFKKEFNWNTQESLLFDLYQKLLTSKV